MSSTSRNTVFSVSGGLSILPLSNLQPRFKIFILCDLCRHILFIEYQARIQIEAQGNCRESGGSYPYYPDLMGITYDGCVTGENAAEHPHSKMALTLYGTVCVNIPDELAA